MTIYSSILVRRIPWGGGTKVLGISQSWTQLRTTTLHFWWVRVVKNSSRNKHSLLCFKGPPWWLSGEDSTCQFMRYEFDPWVQKVPWRRKQQSIPVFLPGKSLDRGVWWATVHVVTKESDTTQHPNNINNCALNDFFQLIFQFFALLDYISIIL